MGKINFIAVALFGVATFSLSPSTAIAAGEKPLTSSLAAPARVAAVDPGWECQFNSASDFAQFTVIDANNDAESAYAFDYWGTWVSLFTDGESQYGSDYPDHCAGYTCSEDNDADDWLITPPIRLQGGHAYKVKFKARAHKSFLTERMEVKAGTAPTAEGMTITLMAPTDIEDTEYKDYTYSLEPSADGLYYVGFHAISEADNMILYLDDVAVEEGQASVSIPAVTDLKVTPDADGAMKAKLEFVVPDVKDGKGASIVDFARVMRGETMIDEIPVDGAGPIQWEDENAGRQPGMVTYTVQLYSSTYGTGDKATLTTWVGLDSPTTPTGVKATIDGSNINLTWNASEAQHDGVFKPAEVVYTVSQMLDAKTVQRDVAQSTGTPSATVKYVVGNMAQREYLFAVSAKNSTGSSDLMLANKVVLGNAYKTPFRELFAKSGNNYSLWTSEGTGFGYENGYATMTVGAADDASGDGGCADISTYYEDRVALLSGKISLAGTSAPVLTFCQNTSSTTGSIETFVLTPDNEYKVVATEQLSAYASSGKWVMRKVDLSAFKALDYVRVGVRFCQSDATYKEQHLYIDNLFVGDLPTTDLAVSVKAPAKVRRGHEAEVKVVVNNFGATAVAAYDVKLTQGDKEVAAQHIDEALAPSASRTFTFRYAPSWLSGDESETMTATIAADGDALADNNTSAATIAVIAAPVPGVSGLTAQCGKGSAVELAWTAPAEVQSLCDTFDDYDPWSISGIGDWTFIDGDKGKTAGYFDDQYIYYENEHTPFAYIVWTPTDYSGNNITSANPSVKPYSGLNALASVYSYHRDEATHELTRIDADNWMVSPELTGRAQTIKFRVSNFSTKYPETYEVLWSEGGTDVADFTRLAEQTVSNGKWEEVSFNLPEGARRFAIRHTTKVVAGDGTMGFSSYPYLFLVDDVTFAPKGCDLTGYNIYRDGTLAGTVSTTAFTDTAAPTDGAEHVYQVTAVYADGTEAAPASAAVVTTTGISSVESGVEAQPTRVFTLDGKPVPSGVKLQRGVYVVNGKKVVVVR